MPRYQKGTQGKLSVQDWDIITSYDDEPLLYILTRQQAASLLGMTDFLHWLTRWKNAPGQDEIDAFASETEFNLMNPITCEMLTECLQPLFDDIGGRIDLLETGTQAINDILGNNTGTIPPGVQESTAGKICSGASFVVEFMDSEIRRVYQEAEDGLLDNLVEATVEIIRAIPVIESLPLDEMVNAINLMFSNQVADYIIDYDALYDDLIGSLACFIEAHDDTFNIEIWAQWLEFLSTEYPTNRAALLFSAFSPLRQTLVNEILAGIFSRPTLSQWFTMIMAEYEAGIQGSIACPTYTCPAFATEPIIDASPCDDPEASDGTNIEDLGSGRWRVTSTANFTDAGVGVKDVAGAPFKIANVTFPDLLNVSAAWTLAGDDECTFGSTPPVNTALEAVLWTWQDEDVGARVEFDFLPV